MSRTLNRKYNNTLKPLRVAVFALAILLMAGIFANEAHAVRVSLQRVIFAGAKKSEVITIINNTAKEQTYRLGWKKFRMDEAKSLSSIDKGEQSDDILWAENMVRYAPRRITIPAGGSQQIRLMLRRPKEIQEAEYRAHLWIISEGKPPEFDAKPDGKKQEIRLSVQPAISLPVFVRHGAMNAKASISDAVLKPGKDGLDISFSINREGNRSIYGDFDFACVDGGKETILRQARGIAVYLEIGRRLLSYDLPLGSETVNSCNTVKITFRSSPNDPQFKGAILAETTVSR